MLAARTSCNLFVAWPYWKESEVWTGRVHSVAAGVSSSEVTLSEICDLRSEVRRGKSPRRVFSNWHRVYDKHTRLHQQILTVRRRRALIVECIFQHALA